MGSPPGSADVPSALPDRWRPRRHSSAVGAPLWRDAAWRECPSTWQGVQCPSMRPALALIHGVRAHQPVAELERLWVAALERGIPDLSRRAEIRLIHWAGHAGTHADAPPAHVIRKIGDRLMRFLSTNQQAEGNFLRAFTADLVAASQTLTRNAIVDGLIPAVNLEHPPLKDAVFIAGARVLSDWIMDEIHAYLYEPDRREAIRAYCQATLDTLTAEGRSLAVVAHSMGCLIASDMLATRAQEGRPYALDLFLTLADPLGYPAVLAQVTQPLEVPDGIQRRVNVAARHDLVANPASLGSLVAPNPRTGVAVEDVLIDNPLGNWGNFDTFHAFEGYLQSPPVVEAVKSWLDAAEAYDSA